jgi:REP element-mobilizing transposase RayT
VTKKHFEILPANKIATPQFPEHLPLFQREDNFAFGGSLNQNKRKIARPIFGNIPLHIVLKATDSFTLLPNRKAIEDYMHNSANKFQITIHAEAVQPDHVHILAEYLKQDSHTPWLRSMNGVLARRFDITWKYPPYTKWVTDSGYFERLKKYIEWNRKKSDFSVLAYARAEQWRDNFLPTTWQKC